jgi:hypothetical protein
MSDFTCSGCSKPHKHSLYAVCQLSQGHTLTFKCDCGKETTLTPRKYRKARDRMRAARKALTP